MTFSSIAEWANNKVATQNSVIGFSQYSAEFLQTNFNQALFYEIVSISDFLSGSQQYLASKCLDKNSFHKRKGSSKSDNIVFQECRSDFDQEEVQSMLNEVEKMIFIAQSIQERLLELVELQKFEVNG